MEIRKAAIDDVDELVKRRMDMRIEREDKQNVDLESFRENTFDYFTKHILNGSFIAWIALDEGKVVATSGLCFYCVPPTYENLSGNVAYMMNMYTIPDYRRKGIASKLLDNLLEEARQRNCTKVILNASKMGRPLYAQYGFKDVQDDMVFYIR